MGHKGSKHKKDLTHLSEEEIDRLTKNTTYSRQQILDWHQGFLRDCPNGKLDKKKFFEVYKKFYPEGKAEKFCTQVFTTFDSDGNGYIDFIEFLIAVNITSHGDVREKLRLAFDMYDMNKNGKFFENMGHDESKTPSTELADETIDRLTKNTKYTPEQIRKWHTAFLHDCPTGQLSSQQFVEVYKKFYPSSQAEKYSYHVFRTFDTDQSGYIDFVEFLVAVNINANGDIHDKLSLAFDVYDINGDGQIDKKEMTKVITAIYDLLGEEHRKGDNSPENRVKTIMDKLDLNDDKSISRDEFVEGCLKDEILRHLLAPNV